MAVRSEALRRCRECIDGKRSFLLQGGAGSGKTESLKELLLYIRDEKPTARLVCITHTNAAVAEIRDRVGDGFTISTIHSFLYSQIRHYRKNILEVLPEVFQLEKIPVDCKDHDTYKELYKKYNQQHYELHNRSDGIPAGAKDYRVASEARNRELNDRIDGLNREIREKLEQREPAERLYNETQFNRFKDRSFGHDGLLRVFCLLFEKYPLLRRILQDKYDYIFIDEFQDTDTGVLKALLELPEKDGLSVGLFGDHMQSIYEKDPVDLKEYADAGRLELIPKEDNYRCSYEVIDHINSLRDDGVEQKVAFKKKADGILETEEDRHGSVKVLYAVVDSKPTAHGSEAAKKLYHKQVQQLIDAARRELGDEEYKVLILTNKEIAAQNGFKALYKVFDDRYSAPREQIELELRKIQALDVAELCLLYKKKQYNELICRVRKGGYEIKGIREKERLRGVMETLLTDPELSIRDAVQKAVDAHLIEPTQTRAGEIARSVERETDAGYLKFLDHYDQGIKTAKKQIDAGAVASEEEFKAFDRIRRRENYYQALFSQELKFSGVIRYLEYLEEGTRYITMHKTKGTSIPSVIVVMEEFFWTEYDFRQLWQPRDGAEKKLDKSRKLFYVACSRARRDLVCVRLVTGDEEGAFREKYPRAVRIGLD